MATQPTTTFTHAGVEITLTPNGKFRATINGAVVLKGSLKAIHLAINKQKKDTFKPFTVLLQKREGPVRVKIVRIDKAKGFRSKGRKSYFTQEGRETLLLDQWITLYKDCPEALARIKKLTKIKKERDAINVRLDREVDRACKELDKFKVDPPQ